MAWEKLCLEAFFEQKKKRQIYFIYIAECKVIETWVDWLSVVWLFTETQFFLNKIVPLSPPVGMELKIKKVKLTSRLFF